MSYRAHADRAVLYNHKYAPIADNQYKTKALLRTQIMISVLDLDVIFADNAKVLGHRLAVKNS